MGAWGVTPLENDAALDVIYLWEEWAEKLGLSPESTVDRFIKHWGDALEYGDSVTNMEVIALTTLLSDRSLTIPQSLRTAAIDATNRELQLEALELWENPEERRRALLSTLELLGGTERAPKKRWSFFDPALSFRNTADATRSLNRLSLRRERAPSSVVLGESYLPPFLKLLSRLVNYRVWEKDSHIWEQARRERLMMIAWFVAEHLRMNPDERENLIARCAQWPAA